MRNKIFLIKGAARIAEQITIATHERINADYVSLIAALRHPEFLPDRYSCFEADPTSMYTCIPEIMEHWRLHHNEHHVVSEYGSTVVNRGTEVRVVEGFSLKADWFYNTVRSLHRSYGQIVVECEVLYHRQDALWLRIEETECKLNEAIERLKPASTLG